MAEGTDSRRIGSERFLVLQVGVITMVLLGGDRFLKVRSGVRLLLDRVWLIIWGGVKQRLKMMGNILVLSIL
jgi:hypothetical protein